MDHNTTVKGYKGNGFVRYDCKGFNEIKKAIEEYAMPRSSVYSSLIIIFF